MDQSGAEWSQQFPEHARVVMQFTLMLNDIATEPAEPPDGVKWYKGKVLVKKNVLIPKMFMCHATSYAGCVYLRDPQFPTSTAARCLCGDGEVCKITDLMNSHIHWKYLQ